jgi:FkbM family methyltransferase
LQRYSILWRQKAFRLGGLPKLISNVVCVDIGASHFPHNKWWLFLQSPAVQWIAVDPDLSSLGYLDRWPWRCSVKKAAVALGATTQARELTVTNVASGSSLLSLHDTLGDAYRIGPQERSYFLPTSQKTIETVGILDFLDKRMADSRCLLKLDTQGTEYELIQACIPLMKTNKILAIETEISLLHTPPYKQAPRLWDIASGLESHGFELLLLDVFQKQGHNKSAISRQIASEADAVFILRRERVLSGDLQFRLQLLAVYLTYQLIDEAHLLLRDDQELSALIQNVFEI